MKRYWEPDELAEHFTLQLGDWDLIVNKTEDTRLGFTVLLKYIQYEGTFPKQAADVPPAVVTFIAQQVGVAADKFAAYAFKGRTIEHHRSQIREALQFRPSTEHDLKELSAWLAQHILPEEHYTDAVKIAALDRLRTLRLEPPTSKQLRRALKSTKHAYEEQLATKIADRLAPEVGVSSSAPRSCAEKMCSISVGTSRGAWSPRKRWFSWYSAPSPKSRRFLPL